ncbi:hypothetical protein ACFV0C_22500 [Streptomyces sp. NPDC059568]|uniref:hypothetical protein n=1 Tax=Streptomyces sp. NPDC059568 TaxID=3346868 RepID=UPI0036B3E7F2
MPGINTDAARERNPFLEAVGRVTLAGAELDISLKGLLGSIARESTLIMYANSQNTSKLIEFCKLALTVGHLEPEDVTEISACLTRAEKCRDRRNTIVHAIYAPAESGGRHRGDEPREEEPGLSSLLHLRRGDGGSRGRGHRTAGRHVPSRLERWCWQAARHEADPPPTGPGQTVNGVSTD